MSFPPGISQDEDRLGELAMKFRGTRRDAERTAIAKDYSNTVERLIQSGGWHEIPPPKTNSPTPGCPRPSLNTGRDAVPRSHESEAMYRCWICSDNPQAVVFEHDPTQIVVITVVA